MNRKGQALVEFILILPIFLMILFTIIDFGNLLYKKNELQNQSTDIIRLINNGENLDNIKDIYSKLEIYVTDFQESYQKVVLVEKVNLITPFLNRVFGNPCSIKVERIVSSV